MNKLQRLAIIQLFHGGELGIRTLGEFPHTAFRAFGVKWNVVESNGTKWNLKTPQKS